MRRLAITTAALGVMLGSCTATSGTREAAPERAAEPEPAAARGAESEPDSAGAGDAAAPSAETFVHDERFCVPESMTVRLPPDRQAPVRREVGACGNFVDDDALERNPIPCGPCGFVFDPEATEDARKRSPGVCCYEVSSPPPPDRPPDPSTSAIDPRWACGRNGDCMASCRHGAVARTWWESTYPGGEACEDGCTSKGTQPPVCTNGKCVARRDGADDPACTFVESDSLPKAAP